MKKRLQKVAAPNGNVEVLIGDEPPSSHDIMQAVAKSFSIYEATVWLNTPMQALQDKTPAEAMKEGLIDEVFQLVKKL